MENTKKEVKKEIKENVKEFKEYFKLTPEEIQKYPKVICRIEKIVSNKGNVFFNLTTRFAGNLGNYKLRKSIDENQYNHFIRHHKLDPDKGMYIANLPIRFITGVSSKNDKEYFSYQVFLSNKLAINNFFNNFDKLELEDLGYNMEFEKRSDVVDVEFDVEW